MAPEDFADAMVATRTLLESRCGRAIAAYQDEEDPCSLAHLSWMLARSTGIFIEGYVNKANRWLGYVQGVMAAKGHATLAELKQASAPLGRETRTGGAIIERTDIP